jgi:hypothetical protein
MHLRHEAQWLSGAGSLRGHSTCPAELEHAHKQDAHLAGVEFFGLYSGGLTKPTFADLEADSMSGRPSTERANIAQSGIRRHRGSYCTATMCSSRSCRSSRRAQKEESDSMPSTYSLLVVQAANDPRLFYSSSYPRANIGQSDIRRYRASHCMVTMCSPGCRRLPAQEEESDSMLSAYSLSLVRRPMIRRHTAMHVPAWHHELGRVYGNASTLSHASTAYGTLVQFIASPWKLIIAEEQQITT